MSNCKKRKAYKLTGSLSRNTFKNIIDEAVQDSHRLVGDTRIRVHLLEDCYHESDTYPNPSFESNTPL